MTTLIDSQQQPPVGPDPVGNKWGLRLGGVVAWSVAALILCAVAGFLGAVAGGSVGMFAVILLTFFLAMSVRQAMRLIRRAQGLAVLGYLESAVRLNMPLAFYLRAAAAGETGNVNRRLMSVALALESGIPLGDAIEWRVPEISRRTGAALASAEGVGQLQPALTRLFAEESGDAPATPADRAPVAAYPLTIGFACAALLLFMLIFVVPRFQEVFKDFATPLPRLTQDLISIGGVAADNAFLAAILVVGTLLFILIFLGRTLRETFTPWWPAVFVGRVTDYLSWRVPVWRALQRNRALADICQFIGDAVRAGAPLPDALTGAKGLHMNHALRQRLVEWREGLLRGLAASRAAAAAGMPAMMVGFLDAASVPGKAAAPDGVADVMEFLARHYRMRFSHLATVITSALEPAVTLCLAVLVGTTVVALILPLAALQRAVEGYGPGGFL